MPPKRKRDTTDLDAARMKFRNRGDLGLLKLRNQFDCVLKVGDERLELHKAILISRSGRFRKLLAKTGKMPVDDGGRIVLAMDSHDLKSVDLVVEFIYGEAMVEILEYPYKGLPSIQNCILLYNLGHDFDIPKLVAYATDHLGMYLSKKLQDICLYPVPMAMQAVALRAFIDDLEAGITQVYKTEPIDEKPNNPRDMLIDFVVAGRDVLFRDADWRCRISQDMLPAAFLKDVLLAEYGTRYKTPWMKKLRARPEKLNNKPEDMKKKRSCDGCGEGITKDQTMVFNPWSGPSFAQRYAQVCCEDCAQEMDKGNGKGVEWGIFADSKE